MAQTSTQQIRTQLNRQWVRFQPGQGSQSEPVTFEAVVYNEGAVFASFRPTLLAHGAEDSIGADWYRFVPAVSAKIPPGDSTRFLVEIFAVPPQRRGFTGSMSLALETYSPELNASDRKDLKLLIEGSGLQLPQLTLNVPDRVEARPQERLTLDLTAFNANRRALTATFTLSGLPEASWVVGGDRQTVTLPANQAVPVSFTLQLPGTTQAPSGDYTVIMAAYPAEIQDPSPEETTAVQTTLRVLPQGKSQFAIAEQASDELQLPDPAYRWLNPRSATATYHLTLDNQSNQAFQSQIAIHNPKRTQQQARQAETQALRSAWRWPWKTQAAAPTAPLPAAPLPAVSDPVSPEPNPSESGTAPDDLAPDDLAPDSPSAIEAQQVIHLTAGETAPVALTIERRLPWLGWSRLEQLEAQAVVVGDGPEIVDDVQPLRLQLLPVVPFWLQLTAGGFLLLLLAALWGARSLQGHRGPVYAVEFDGRGQEVISASQDQTLRRWPVERGHLERSRLVRRTDGEKALRQARYRPFNNNEIALAMENGEVEILDLLSGQALSLVGDRADRVFDLAFSRDARTFFSGHGSGLVRQWDLSANPPVSEDFRADFAIRALALAGPSDRYLVIAGRYNQVVVLDRETQALRSIDHGQGGGESFVRSLATADEDPFRLAISDDQGRISLWDLRCLTQPGGCQQPLDEWSTAHNGEAVHAVALSADACFLASAGDDGRTKLWPLSRSGQRLPNQEETVTRSRQRQNAVDLVRLRDRLLVVSGGDDHRIRLNRLKLRSRGNSSCPELQ